MLTLFRSRCVVSHWGEALTSTLLHREQEQTTIRQMKVLLVDVLAHQQQITVVLSIVKRTQFHTDSRLTRRDDSGELEEG